jgi:protein TonB
LSAVAAAPVITPADRLALTLCLAALFHAVILLGVTFAKEDKLEPRYDTMEIVLVQQESKVAPEDASVLAQANLEGGGETDEQLIPATPLPPPFPAAEAQVAAPPTAPAPPPAAPVQPAQLLAADAADAAHAVPETARQPPKEEAARAEPAPAEPVDRPKPSATALLSNSFKIAALSAEIKRKLEAQAQRPKRKFISASTKEYRYASYMEAWRAKVERVGNLNYPDEARKRQLSGSLILDVALNPDGSVNQITVRQSSGHRILDDAADRIVRLAAPFSPFPDDIRKETDILHITRTWQFLHNRGFR